VFDLVLLNGSVLTPAAAPHVSAVAVQDGRIACLGTSADVLRDAGPKARRIDLGGRTVIPGFNDAHAHVWKIGHLRTTMLDVRGARSIEELVAAVRAFSEQLPRDSWVLGRGYNEARLRERRLPTRHDLDAAVRDRPVALTRTCGHIYAVNTVALERARIGPNTPDPVGGVIERDESGHPTGLLHETAMGLVGQAIPQPRSGDYAAMITAGLRHQLSLGITSSSDCGVAPELLEVYREMDDHHSLPARVNVMPLRCIDGVAEPVPLPSQTVRDMLRVDTIKFLADGGLSGATAAISSNYRHASTTGVLRFDRNELLRLCRETHDGGWRIATHAIGDVAIEQVLGIFEDLGPHPRGLSHRIEHFGLPDGTQLQRAARLQVVAVPQTVFIHSLGPNFRQYLPDAFLPRCYPVRAMIDAGLTVALSSDAPVVEDDNPLLGMAAAFTRRDSEGVSIAPEQAISVGEALYAYTMGGARASGDEQNRGSLDPGKWADLAVLSANPSSCDPEALTDIRVEMTLVAGQVVYER
jgi:predicted amidohydrolase YtcJ